MESTSVEYPWAHLHFELDRKLDSKKNQSKEFAFLSTYQLDGKGQYVLIAGRRVDDCYSKQTIDLHVHISVILVV